MKNRKSFKYGSYAVLLTVIVVAVTVLVNAILGFASIRPKLKIDVTKEKMYTIGDKTKEVLSKLEKDVEIIVLTAENKYDVDILKKTFEQYQANGNGKITIRYVDLDKDPRFITRELDPEKVTGIAEGDIVVKCGDRIKLIQQSEMVESSYDESGYSQTTGLKIEQAFTSAISNVTSASTPVVYFVTGHGEAAMSSALTQLTGTLDVNNYEVKETNLLEGVPEDAAALVFVEPQQDLLAAEMDTLLAWTDKGGDLIVMLGAQPEGSVDYANFNKVLEKYNLALQNDLVIEDSQSNYVSDKQILIPYLLQNDVTTALDQESLRILLPTSRSVAELGNTKEWVKTSPIFQTSDQSYRLTAESGYQSAEQGPMYLGWICEYTGGTNASKAVVIGNSNMITDSWLDQAASYDNGNGKRYFVAMLNWMQDSQSDIYIPAKSTESAALTMSELQKSIVRLLVSIIIPLAFVGSGIFVWMRRRHL